MGAKSRAAMEAARRSLEARKAEVLGATAPPCDNCKAPSDSPECVDCGHTIEANGRCGQAALDRRDAAGRMVAGCPCAGIDADCRAPDEGEGPDPDAAYDAERDARAGEP